MDQFQQILNAMTSSALTPQTAAVAIAVIGLNIHFGYTGLLNIGQSAFMLLGAYGFAITIKEGALGFEPRTFGAMVLGVFVGLGLAFLFALVLGVPTLKLRGDYLAIVTISAAEIVRYVGRSVGYEGLFHLTGGAQGIPGSQYRKPFTDLMTPHVNGDENATLLPFSYKDVTDAAAFRVLMWLVLIALIAVIVMIAKNRIELADGARRGALVGLGVLLALGLLFIAPVTNQKVGVDGWWVTFVAYALAILSTVVVLILVKSPWGRALRGVREDEDAMRSLGKNVFAIKMQALVIGGLFGALGGIVYVLPSTVQPDNMGRALTFYCYTALLLGGAAAIWGPILGSVIFFAGRIGVIGLTQAYVPDSVMSNQEATQFAYIVVGVALMLLVIFRPQGILGDKRELRFNV